VGGRASSPYNIDPALLLRWTEKKGITRSASSRTSLRRDNGLKLKEKYKKMQRLASMPGDSELADYMDNLARDPERFSQPQDDNTGETTLHILSKEGKVEIIETLLNDERMEDHMVSALLVQDKLGWTPFMSATKADTGAREIMEKFLQFLIQHMPNNDPSSDCLNKLIETKNKSNDTLFTLLMRNGHEDFGKSREKLFELMQKHSNPQEMAKWFNILVRQLAEPNSCDLTARSMKELILLVSRTDVDLKTVMTESDRYGNTMLMELAKNMKDEALREILTSSITSNHVTHQVLLSSNVSGQTLLTLIEVNRESLSESLPLVLKREYGCHRRDMRRTELCLSEQLETSASASEIIVELHQLEPKSFCQIFFIWAVLFFTSLMPNVSLATFDIASDSFLVLSMFLSNNLIHQIY